MRDTVNIDRKLIAALPEISRELREFPLFRNTVIEFLEFYRKHDGRKPSHGRMLRYRTVFARKRYRKHTVIRALAMPGEADERLKIADLKIEKDRLTVTDYELHRPFPVNNFRTVFYPRAVFTEKSAVIEDIDGIRNMNEGELFDSGKAWPYPSVNTLLMAYGIWKKNFIGPGLYSDFMKTDYFGQRLFISTMEYIGYQEERRKFIFFDSRSNREYFRRKRNADYGKPANRYRTIDLLEFSYRFCDLDDSDIRNFLYRNYTRHDLTLFCILLPVIQDMVYIGQYELNLEIRTVILRMVKKMIIDRFTGRSSLIELLEGFEEKRSLRKIADLRKGLLEFGRDRIRMIADYIRLSVGLYVNYDMAPNFRITGYARLAREHDRLSALYSRLESEADSVPFELDSFTDLIELLPENCTVLRDAAELKAEGIRNNNCAGSYGESVRRGSTLILTADHKDRHYTVEVRKKEGMYEIAQFLAENNRKVDDRPRDLDRVIDALNSLDGASLHKAREILKTEKTKET